MELEESKKINVLKNPKNFGNQKSLEKKGNLRNSKNQRNTEFKKCDLEKLENQKKI